MTTTLTIRDEATSSRIPDREFALDVPSDTPTVREIIEARVRQEVREYNLEKPEVFRGLVSPVEAEITLNGAKMPDKREIDPEAQALRALAAFEGNGVLMLLDDRQAERLDEEVDVTPETTVTFLKLVPLVGG